MNKKDAAKYKIKYTPRERLLLLRGRWRYLFGFCPACNSDAPGIYDCQVCGGWRTPGDGHVRQRISKRLWYGRFKSRIRIPGYGR